MSDSNMTKRVLADTLQALMEEVPFEKISVTMICQRCDMNRKSFYYHFRDKYDLVNWIFDTDFLPIAQSLSHVEHFDEWIGGLHEALLLIDRKRSFYRKALRVTGQNSLSEHLREFCRPLLRIRLVAMVGEADADEFLLDVLTDAELCAVERWVMDRNHMPPEQFLEKMCRFVFAAAESVQREEHDTGAVR